MLNPNDILAAIAAKLRAIPQLATELGGQTENIIPYYDRYPGNGNLREAILTIPKPGILIVWDGTGPGGRGMLWIHRFRLFLRAKVEATSLTDATGGYGNMFALLVNGVPGGGDGLRMIDTRVHPSCDPMQVPSAQRSQLVLDYEGNTIDFFEVPLAFQEIGDN